MPESRVVLDTLTPLWTGDALGRSSRLQESTIIGSLRWWYEALVRGLGGFVGDPTAKDKASRADFDTEVYYKAIREGMPRKEALCKGIKSLGAVEYLFGATGWARLFRIRAVRAPRVPLHFRSTLNMNKQWLGRIFQGQEEQDYAIDDLEVLHGEIEFQLVFRGQDVDYAYQQITLLLRLIEAYGALGARPQHGFGQIRLVTLPEAMSRADIQTGLDALRAKLESGTLRHGEPPLATPYDMHNFFHLSYVLPDSVLYRFIRASAHFGDARMENERDYLPCSFDLRYKGDGSIGFRSWLRNERGWKESDAPPPLGPLDELMGPRSQWENARGRPVKIQDDLRSASRVCFGMPTRMDGGYRLQIFGFAPPEVLSARELTTLCKEYMQETFGAEPVGETLGQDLLGGPK